MILRCFEGFLDSFYQGHMCMIYVVFGTYKIVFWSFSTFLTIFESEKVIYGLFGLCENSKM